MNVILLLQYLVLMMPLLGVKEGIISYEDGRFLRVSESVNIITWRVGRVRGGSTETLKE